MAIKEMIKMPKSLVLMVLVMKEDGFALSSLTVTFSPPPAFSKCFLLQIHSRTYSRVPDSQAEGSNSILDSHGFQINCEFRS